MRPFKTYTFPAILTTILLTGCANLDAGLSAEDQVEIINNGNHRFNVHFSIITNNPLATLATEAQMREEVRILNTYFVSETDENLVEFIYQDTSLYADVSGSGCDLVTMSDDGIQYSSDDWEAAIDACADPSVVDPDAINFFVYDAQGSATSRGRRNQNHPYVLIDYARLNHTNQSPEEHEMGHAFGLGHLCVTGAVLASSTNIMATAGDYTDAAGNIVDCAFSGGQRDLGFTPDQVAEILLNAAVFDTVLTP